MTSKQLDKAYEVHLTLTTEFGEYCSEQNQILVNRFSKLEQERQTAIRLSKQRVAHPINRRGMEARPSTFENDKKVAEIGPTMFMEQLREKSKLLKH